MQCSSLLRGDSIAEPLETAPVGSQIHPIVFSLHPPVSRRECYNKSPAESNFIGRKNQIKPSSEWRFHHDILRDRPSVNAVIHVHSPFATSLACLRKEIPPFHYMIAIAGGRTIRCAPYALFGTQELSNHVMVALEGRHACLMANHGMLAVGKTIGDALRITIEVESLCEQYWRALQLGEPYLLSETQMRDVIEKFKTYGPNDSV
jgi:ribulose-5-phosphate 4-epimerase/fuculose-1-phosphate aldolase